MTARVKICGVMRAEDARFASECGADYVGVILTSGYSRSLEPEQAAAVLAGCSVRGAGVFVDSDVEHVIDLASRLELDVVQLHGNESSDEVGRVRLGGDWEVWKTVRNRELLSLDSLYAFRGLAAGALVDSWHPSRPGGSGVPFEWDGVGARVREVFPGGRFIAAGGLTPETVCPAIRALKPDVVDVSSGVEAELGAKDPERVSAFIQAARDCTLTAPPEDKGVPS